MLVLSRHISHVLADHGRRQAVLLTSSRSAYPYQLPFNKHLAPVSPLFAILTSHSQITENRATSSLLFAPIRAMRLEVQYLPLIRKQPGCIPTIPILKLRLFTRYPSTTSHQSRVATHLLIESGQHLFQEP